MITANLNKIKTISSSSISGLSQAADYNFKQLVTGLNALLESIGYDGSTNALHLGALQVDEDVQFYSALGFGNDPLNPTLKITADGKLVGKTLEAPVVNVTRLRFRDFNDVSNISKPGIPGEVVYVGDGVYSEGIYAYLTTTGWTILTGTGGGGGATALSGLTDVQLSGVTDGDFLQYNASDNKWENSQFTVSPGDFFGALNTVLTAPFVPYWTGTVLSNTNMQYDLGSNTLNIAGNITATTKSFLIDNPVRKGYQLRYGNLEGPEHAVYVRGRSNKHRINLPKHWKWLVDEDSITVSITSIGDYWPNYYVRHITSECVVIGGPKTCGEFFYHIFATRKDVEKLEVEPKKAKTKK